MLSTFCHRLRAQARLIVVALIAFGFGAATPRIATADPLAGLSQSEKNAVSHCLQLIRDRQIDSGPFTGAFRVTAEPNVAWVENYFALEACLALLSTTDSPQSPDVERVKNYLIWYASKLQEPGIAHDYGDYLSDLKDIGYDSIDSYAGLFLLVTARYYALTHTLPTAEVLAAASRSLDTLDNVINNKDTVRMAANGKYAFTPQALSNGLPINKGADGSHFLLDASEAHAGLRESIALFRTFGKTSEAQKAEALANSIASHASAFDYFTGQGSYAGALDSQNAAQINIGRPGALANLFALSYFSPTHPELYAILKQNYREGTHKNEQITDDASNAPGAPSEWWLIAAARAAQNDVAGLRNLVADNSKGFGDATYIARPAITILALIDGAARYPVLELPSTISLSGTVYNAVARGGLSGITIQATPVDSALVMAQTVSDAQGKYTLPLYPGSYKLSASKVGTPAFRISPAFTNPVTISTAQMNVAYDFRALGIGGRVINSSNVGVSGVTLNLYTGSNTTVTSTVASDSQGFFSFDGLAAGTYQVTPFAPTTLAYAPTSRTLTVADKALFTSFTATAKVTYALTGRVTIVNNGTPQGLSGVTLKATRTSDNAQFTVNTDGNGAYTFSNLSAGNYTIAPQNAGLQYTYAPSPAQPQPLSLTAQVPSKSGLNFSATPLISGVVYNAVALSGLPRIVVKAVRQSDGVVFAVGTDTAGKYSLALASGTYTLSAFLPHNDAFRINATFTNPVMVAATVPTRVLSYDFRAIGIGGRITTSSNVGVSGVTVNLYAQSDTAFTKPLMTAITNAQGFFSLDGVAAGMWSVVPTAPANLVYSPASKLVGVADKPIFTAFIASSR